MTGAGAARTGRSGRWRSTERFRPRWWPLTRLELRRVRRDPVLLFFVLVLPVVCFLGFGSLPGPVGAGGVVDHAGLRRMLLVGVAGYGAATAATTVAAQAAVERLQGWGRQIAATPLGDTGYVLAKAVAAQVVAILPVLLTFLVARIAGVHMSPGSWWAAGAWLVLGALMWAAYGLAAGMLGRTSSAMAISAGGLVLMSFAGGAYVPLSGRAAHLSALTPMYGYIALARHLAHAPMVLTPGPSDPGVGTAVANLAGWATVFAVLALQRVRASLARR